MLPALVLVAILNRSLLVSHPTGVTKAAVAVRFSNGPLDDITTPDDNATDWSWMIPIYSKYTFYFKNYLLTVPADENSTFIYVKVKYFFKGTFGNDTMESPWTPAVWNPNRVDDYGLIYPASCGLGILFIALCFILFKYFSKVTNLGPLCNDCTFISR